MESLKFGIQSQVVTISKQDCPLTRSDRVPENIALNCDMDFLRLNSRHMPQTHSSIQSNIETTTQNSLTHALQFNQREYNKFELQDLLVSKKRRDIPNINTESLTTSFKKQRINSNNITWTSEDYTQEFVSLSTGTPLKQPSRAVSYLSSQSINQIISSSPILNSPVLEHTHSKLLTRFSTINNSHACDSTTTIWPCVSLKFPLMPYHNQLTAQNGQSSKKLSRTTSNPFNSSYLQDCDDLSDIITSYDDYRSDYDTYESSASPVSSPGQSGIDIAPLFPSANALTEEHLLDEQVELISHPVISSQRQTTPQSTKKMGFTQIHADDDEHENILEAIPMPRIHSLTKYSTPNHQSRLHTTVAFHRTPTQSVAVQPPNSSISTVSIHTPKHSTPIENYSFSKKPATPRHKHTPLHSLQQPCLNYQTPSVSASKVTIPTQPPVDSHRASLTMPTFSSNGSTTATNDLCHQPVLKTPNHRVPHRSHPSRNRSPQLHDPIDKFSADQALVSKILTFSSFSPQTPLMRTPNKPQPYPYTCKPGQSYIPTVFHQDGSLNLTVFSTRLGENDAFDDKNFRKRTSRRLSRRKKCVTVPIDPQDEESCSAAYFRQLLSSPHAVDGNNESELANNNNESVVPHSSPEHPCKSILRPAIETAPLFPPNTAVLPSNNKPFAMSLVKFVKTTRLGPPLPPLRSRARVVSTTSQIDDA